MSSVTRLLRRLAPQSFRVRLALTYAGMFLAAGAVLLAVTYGLVAHSLPKTSSFTQSKAKEILACKAELHPGSGLLSPKQPEAVPGSCKKVFTAGAQAGASSQRDQTLHNLLLYSLLGLGFTTVLAGLLGAFMAGRALRPVKAITAAARRASTDHLGERLNLSGPKDELKELADTFDEMLDRLDAAFAAQRRFIADASHELRTPLTVMRTAVDVTGAKTNPTPQEIVTMVSRLRRAIDKAQLLVDALLALAMSERDVLDEAVVDLSMAAQDALGTSADAVVFRRLHVNSDLRPAPVMGNRVLLERMVANLVENAVRHNVDGGSIQLRSGNGSDGSWIEISNSGVPVADAEVEELFEPFHRTAARTTAEGVGLGLTIVRSVAQRHHGIVDATLGPDGGLNVRVVLPAIGGPR
jgi:signal transduction histidine kinase